VESYFFLWIYEENLARSGDVGFRCKAPSG